MGIKMGYSFLNFMKEMGIFIICAQSFMHFTAGKSYEKYVKLLIGIMILAQFTVPLKSLFSGSEQEQIEKEIEHFQVEMERELRKGGENFFEDQDNGMSEVEKEIEEKLSESASHMGFVVKSVKLDEGEAKLFIVLGESSGEKERIKIEKVKIERKETGDEESGTKDWSEVKKNFGVVLGIDPSYMEIRME